MPTLRLLPHPFGRLVLVEIGLDEALDAEMVALAKSLPAGVSNLRRATFMAGRLALKEALSSLGAREFEIGRSARGAPLLPRGFIGSLSHKRSTDVSGRGSVIAVALASMQNSTEESLGVDVETTTPARPDIATRILTPLELAETRLIAAEPWPFVLGAFSVKEAIYKAVDPFLGRYVSFLDAELSGQSHTWPSVGGQFLGAKLETRDDEPKFALETFLQAVPEAPELIVAAARATRIGRGATRS